MKADIFEDIGLAPNLELIDQKAFQYNLTRKWALNTFDKKNDYKSLEEDMIPSIIYIVKFVPV